MLKPMRTAPSMARMVSSSMSDMRNNPSSLNASSFLLHGVRDRCRFRELLTGTVSGDERTETGRVIQSMHVDTASHRCGLLCLRSCLSRERLLERPLCLCSRERLLSLNMRLLPLLTAIAALRVRGRHQNAIRVRDAGHCPNRRAV